MLQTHFSMSMAKITVLSLRSDDGFAFKIPLWPNGLMVQIGFLRHATYMEVVFECLRADFFWSLDMTNPCIIHLLVKCHKFSSLPESAWAQKMTLQKKQGGALIGIQGDYFTN